MKKQPTGKCKYGNLYGNTDIKTSDFRICTRIIGLYLQRGPHRWSPPWARPPWRPHYCPLFFSHRERRAARWRSCRRRLRAARWGPPGGRISPCSTCFSLLFWKVNTLSPPSVSASRIYGSGVWTRGRRRRCVRRGKLTYVGVHMSNTTRAKVDYKCAFEPVSVPPPPQRPHQWDDDNNKSERMVYLLVLATCASLLWLMYFLASRLL